MSRTGRPFFSVIVPTHNGAEHIRKALNSVKQQRFDDYELIVVCDDCEDNTEQIAMEYTPNVLSVDYHRDGLARNKGLDAATGEWVLFLDDDDWFLHEYVFSMLHEVCGRQGESIVNYSYVQKNKGYREQTPQNMFMTCWCRCCKRELIGDTQFSDAPYGSDLQFFAELMRKKPGMVFWNTPMIYYNANDRSLNEYRRLMKEGGKHE